MRLSLFLPLVLIAAGLLVLTGALPSRSPSRTRPRVVPDPEALGQLDQALAALDPQRLPTLETAIWQRLRLPGLDFEAEGRYLLGPDHRYKLELQTRLGGRTGTLLQVSDGTHLWQGRRTSPGRWGEVLRARLVPGSDSPAAIPTAARKMGCSFIFEGLFPLLRGLRDRLVWTAQQKISDRGVACVRLTGTWPPGVVEALAPAGEPWPEGLPSECRLWLDLETFWPRRVEWLAPENPAGTAVILAEMELRSPVFQPEWPPQRCQTEFTFDPGTTTIVEVAQPSAL